MDIPVDFLLEKLTQVVTYHVDLIEGAKHEVEQLMNELRSLKAFLKDSSKKYKKDEVFKEWERQIREAVYDVEDAMDSRFTELAVESSKTFMKRSISKATNRISLAKEVRDLREKKVKPLFEDPKVKFSTLSISDAHDTSAAETRQIRQKRRKNKIVGVEDEATKLIGYLLEESKGLEVVSIIGMPGLGKTTVAWKIYQDDKIKFQFPTLIWVNISDDLNVKNVLLTILKKVAPNVPAEKMSNDDMVEMVRDKLNSIKFLIVMDDVWTKETWNELESFLPMLNKQGRVLITSREKKVAYHANAMRNPHKLRFLNKQESWELLQYEIYHEVNVVHKDLEQVGQVIAHNCNGLPLSIIVIGGILKDKISEAEGVVTSTKKEWDDVSKSIETYLVYKDESKRLEKIINLSYVTLPYELRDCFLYLGVFPEDADIHVQKLILLWIAEGFIQKIPNKSLEDNALDNLKELINRNLLIVEKAKADGEAKILRVHDTIRHFCRTEAGFNKLNLFQEIGRNNRGVSDPSLEIVQKCRRLCIHDHVNDFFKEKPKVPKARTFLCSPSSPINLEATNISPVIDAFQLIRVLDAEKIKFPRFPTKLLFLIHLRYLTLSFTNDQVKFLPEAISKLWNLQTLILDIPSKRLEIKADLWLMMHLRHVKTKASIVLIKEGKGGGGDNLQTLSRLSPQSCTDHVFDKAKNLITLGIRGDLSFLLESRCLEKLIHLNKLKLVHKVEHGGASGKPLPRLPEAIRFPRKLKILVLANTNLDWEQMSVLVQLSFLEVLKLKEHAFSGVSWDAGGTSFRKLELLEIERSGIKFWEATKKNFPKLRFLVLKNCEELQEIPSELGMKLETLYIERAKNVVPSAKKFEEARSVEISKGEFVLKIAPADNIQT